MSEVVITGGGTGGHFFPGLAVAEELRRRGVAVSWLGARRGLEASRIRPTGIPLRLHAVTGAVGRSPVAQLGAALRAAPATVGAMLWLLQRDAAAVLSVGGYASVPGALAACSLGVPLILQEQNSLPGFTNRLLAPWASAITCGFATSLAAFRGLPAQLTGNPIRPEFFKAPFRPTGAPAVMVSGGSQGAEVLNRVVPEAIALAARGGVRPRVVHQAGPRWQADVRERYAAFGVPAEVVGFFERPWEALAEASVVIARAGALTVSEIAAAGRFALLVPFAAAAHGHQRANALALAATGAAEVIEEPQLTPGDLAAAVARLLADQEKLVARGAAGRFLAHADATTTIATLVLRKAGISLDTQHPDGGGR